MKTALVLLLLTLSACGYNSTHLKDASATGGDNSGTGDGTVLDFSTVNAQVFAPYCVRCHSTEGANFSGVYVETYADVFSRLKAITAAVNSGFMPKGGVLPAAAKDLLNAWAQAGAPEVAVRPLAPGFFFDASTQTIIHLGEDK